MCTPDFYNYFPMPPLFTEARLTNCYFHPTAFSVVGSTILAGTLVVVYALVRELLFRRTNRHQRAIKRMLILGVLHLLSGVSGIVLVWTVPFGSKAVYYQTAISLLILGVWIVAFLHVAYGTVFPIVRDIDSEKKTFSQYVGDAVAMRVHLVSLLLVCFMFVASLIAYMYFIAVDDFDSALLAWRIACSDISLGCLMTCLMAYRLYGRFACGIEETLAKVDDNTRNPSSISPSASGRESAKEKMAGVAKQCRQAQVGTLMISIPGVILVALQASILPTFMWILLVQYVTIAKIHFDTYILVTPKQRRTLVLSWIDSMRPFGSIGTHSKAVSANASHVPLDPAVVSP